MSKTQNSIEQINRWIKNSIMLKLFTISGLILILLIPSSMIKSIIREREYSNDEAIHEVSSKWANSQVINGPILTIPLIYEYEKEVEKERIVKGTNGDRIELYKEMVTYEVVRKLHLLPDDLNLNGTINPKKLKRGIYEIVVYQSKSSIEGAFTIDPEIDQKKLKTIQWDQALLTLGISDLRGISEEVILKWNGHELKAKPGSKIPGIISSGITFELPAIKESGDQKIDFQCHLNLQGSENMSFTPVGGVTRVNMKSEWPAPSFNGSFLPDSRNVTDAGFHSNWKVLQLNRNFPQGWIGDQFKDEISNAQFGVNLILPMDDYKKSMRSAKYAVMTIALSFLIFFLVEILNNRRIHPFQYTLVGLSLCLFYVLLISISEHSNFNLAYGIATSCVVAMITLYSLSVFKAPKLTLILSTMLVGIYGLLFVILQLADYALLMGSIGLTLTLAATMFFTRNINWYQLKTTAN